MKRHLVQPENKYDLRYSRNECVFPSFADKVLKEIKFNPSDLCQYDSSYQVLNNIATKLNCDINTISAHNGSECVIRSIAEELSAEKWVFTNPTFELAKYYISRYSQYEVVDYIYNNGFSLSFDSIKDKKDKTLYIVSPHNPTGCVHNIEALCNEFKYVVLDEAYINPMSPLPVFDNLITIRTFSKMGLLSGVRFGFCHGPVDLIERINSIRPMYMSSMTNKLVNHIIDNDITDQLELYIKNDVLPKYSKYNPILHCGNFILLKNDPIGNLKKYVFGNHVFWRMTLNEFN